MRACSDVSRLRNQIRQHVTSSSLSPTKCRLHHLQDQGEDRDQFLVNMTVSFNQVESKHLVMHACLLLVLSFTSV